MGIFLFSQVFILAKNHVGLKPSVFSIVQNNKNEQISHFVIDKKQAYVAQEKRSYIVSVGYYQWVDQNAWVGSPFTGAAINFHIVHRVLGWAN